ncbi:unnamed protein product [Staurois parvus]|uniref:Uncharacterized protein n=1 Tax=Staurois parvus TaxID=386267 RepID=A0ABN9FZD3_9NEOB|nr:unnamed protein product [Staurois parvus]
MGGRTGTHERLWTCSSMRRRQKVYRGLCILQIRGLAAVAIEARNLPATYVKKFNTPAFCVRDL